MRTLCFGENVKPIWTSVRISFKKRKYRFLAHVRLQRSEKHLHVEGNSLWCCSSYTEANLKGNQINMLLFWQKLQIRFCLDLSHYTINQHPSFLLLSLSTPLRLHLSSRPRASPSFIFLCHSLPSVRLSLTVSGDGGLCSLHLIWHFLHYCDQTAEPNQKLQVYSAAGCRQRWCQRLTSPSNVRLQWIGASNVVITAPDHWQK